MPIVILLLERGFCVGAYISTYVILTAAHCVAPTGPSTTPYNIRVQENGARGMLILTATGWSTQQYTINDFAFLTVNLPTTKVARVSQLPAKNNGRYVQLPVVAQTMYGRLVNTPLDLHILVYDIPIYHGTSGAPIIDHATQEILGVNSAFSSSGGAGPRITQATLREYGIPVSQAATPTAVPTATPIRNKIPPTPSPTKKRYTVRIPLSGG